MAPLALILGAIILGVMNLNTIREYFIGASGEPANLVVDVSAVLGPMPRPWRNLAQGGEDKNWRMNSIAEKVKVLNPEYIRLDHIYDFYEPVRREGDQLVFDFSRLDLIIDDILAVGAKPYISISYTPGPIAPDGNITGMPTNLSEYQVIVQRTIEHLSKTRAIEGVIYEVWNEPDLFGEFRVYGRKNYLELYGAAARGAQAAVVNGARPFQFGGPATTALYKNWIDGLATFAIENNYRLDFISWHRYDRSAEVYRQDVANVRAWLASYPQLFGVQLHITEWGHDSTIDPGYDTIFGAAHTGAIALDMVGQVDRAFVFEIQDGKDPSGQEYWGRWGILTHQDFGSRLKPRYKMLQFLDRLADQRLQLLGKGSWVKAVAAKNGEQVQVAIVNYDPAGTNLEQVPVTFTNIDTLSYDLTIQYFEGQTMQKTIATTSGQLSVGTTIPMQANSAVFVTAVPTP